MEKSKKDFEDLSYILRFVLSELKTPLSVSFLNTEFASKFKHQINSGITLDFMKIFKDEFMFNVIGSDIKVQLKEEREQSVNKEYQLIADQVTQIFRKHLNKLDDIIKKMQVEKSMLFDKFCKDFSSNKYRINLPSVNRNSHKLKIKAQDGETYVEISEEDNIFIDENKFWEIIEAQGFEELIFIILINLSSKFYRELDQGLLQVCFKYDYFAIDGSFMIRRERYFDRTEQTKFKLKEKFRKLSESLLTTSTSTTATMMSTEHRIIDHCASNLGNVSHEIKTQEAVSEFSSNGDNHVTKILTSETEISSSSVNNSDTDSDEDLVTDTNFTSDDDSDVDTENETPGDESPEVAEEDLEEKKEKQSSDNEAVRNEKRLEGANANTNPVNLFSRKGKEKVEKSEMDITDGSNDSGLIRKSFKEKSKTNINEYKYKRVKHAMKSGRLVIVPGKSDGKPLFIGFSHSPEKRRQQIADIGVTILREMQK